MSTYPEYADRGSSGSSVNRWLVVALLIVLGVLVVRMWDFGDFGRGPLHDPSVELRTQNPAGNLAEDERTTISLFKAARPSVVNITTTSVRRDRFTLNPIEIPQGTGSGFVWSYDKDAKTAYIVTNFHVIQEASRARVTLADETTELAEYVGGDPDNDLAVLLIRTKSPLVPLRFGTSSKLQVGQKVFAIGNPFGLDHSLTTGVISGLEREIQSVSRRTIRDVIQTDAAINPGNSGGPLLESDGDVIGVNTAIYSPSGAFAGVGFAIPVDTVNRVVTQLIGTGTFKRPGLGIFIDNYAEGDVRGVLIGELVPSGAAEAAGVREGDVIVKVDDEEVKTTSQLIRLIEQRDVGDTVKLGIRRDEESVTLEVTLQAMSSAPSRKRE
jgi:S1-C subfamily serine protease